VRSAERPSFVLCHWSVAAANRPEGRARALRIAECGLQIERQKAKLLRRRRSEAGGGKTAKMALGVRDSRPAARGPWPAARGPWPAARGPPLVTRGPPLVTRGSPLAARRSWPVARRSWPVARRS